MNHIRAKFEEIWPVPEGVYWIDYPGGGYYAPYKRSMYEEIAEDWNGRLKVFTRCQETMFSKEELNLFRQWFNAVEDLSPAYLEKSDCDLYRKVMEMMK